MHDSLVRSDGSSLFRLEYGNLNQLSHLVSDHGSFH